MHTLLYMQFDFKTSIGWKKNIIEKKNKVT